MPATKLGIQLSAQSGDDVILNDGATTPEILRARAKTLHEEWCAMASAMRGKT